MTIRRCAQLAIVLAVATVAAAGCGDDKEKAVSTATVTRYCDISSQIDDATVGTGAASAPGVFDGAPESVSGALQPLAPILAELESVAPEEIEAEAKTMAQALDQARTGNLELVQTPEFTAAAQKTIDFRSRSCPDTGTSGEG